MKRFLLLTVVYVFVLSGMAYAAEIQTRTWTDADGVTHTVTITRERSKVMESGDTAAQSAASEQKSQESQPQTAKEPERPKQEYRKTDLPAGMTPNGSFQFDINSDKPKN